MDWQDEEFEVFLRQFQPRTPKALPTHRRTLVGLTAAAVVAAAVLIPAWRARPTIESGHQPPSTSTTNSPVDGSGQRGGDIRPAPRLSGAQRGYAVPQPTFRGTRQPGARQSGEPASTTSNALNGRVRVGGAVKAPVKIFDVKPVYPEDAQTAGIQGVVILDIVIGEDGSVIEAQVIRSIPELDQAAIDAVRQWLFEPTLLNNEPVEVEMTVTVNFTLR